VTPSTTESPTLASAAERLETYLSLLDGLVTRESPTGDVERIGRVAGFLAEEMERRGARVERHPVEGVGVHLVGRWEGGAPDGGPLLLVGHMDTVHPVGTLERYPYRVDEGRVRGPGSYDMKGGLAVALEALSLLASRGELPRSDVTLLVTCDEEEGSSSSRDLIAELARSASAALVLEPSAPGGRVKSRRKGISWYMIKVHGRAAHSGIEPEAGASAVHELARQTLRLLALGDSVAGTTVNVGVVGGGTRSNVVAEEAWAQMDVRFWTREEALRVDAAVRALRPEDPRCRIDLEGGIDRMPLEQTEASDHLFRVASEEASRLGFQLERTGTGGGSDGNLTSAVGCPTLDGLGPDGGGAHTLDEHILLADIPRRIALLAGLFRRL
jgi:glutamate carboxypeptidase